MDEICNWSAAKTADNIRNRKVSCTEVVEAHLRRMEEINPSINAVTELVSDSVDIAKAIDSKKLPDTTESTPLLGVPVLTKCNVDQQGCINSNGIAAFANNRSDKDSAVVGNLRKSGAIIIGRTNTPEFSMRWCTSNPLHGVSLNPWDNTVTPGGSSGAAAAAVASGIGAIAHGNDLGGSLRYPAYCCGVTTIRPSMGRIPAFNPCAAIERPPITQTMSVQGPIARSVADVRLGLQSMCMRSSSDPLYVNAPDSGRDRKRVATIGFAANPFPTRADASVNAAMAVARDGFTAAGLKVVNTNPPQADEAAMLWGKLLFTETEITMKSAIEAYGSAEINRLTQEYGTYFGCFDLAGLFDGMSQRLRLQRLWSEMFDDIDALLLPVSLIAPFENDLDFKQPESIAEILDAQKPLFVVNLLGLPSVTIPTHVENGIPSGVQLIGPMHDDWHLLDLAGKLEQQIGTLVHQLPVPFGFANSTD